MSYVIRPARVRKPLAAPPALMGWAKRCLGGAPVRQDNVATVTLATLLALLIRT